MRLSEDFGVADSLVDLAKSLGLTDSTDHGRVAIQSPSPGSKLTSFGLC